MKIIYKNLCFLILPFIFFGCKQSSTESPLTGLKPGLWIPVNTYYEGIPVRATDAPDIIQNLEIPLWIIDNQTQITSWNRIFFTHELTQNNDGYWYINILHCQFSTSTNKDTLICTYVDAYDKKHIIPYTQILEKSVVPKNEQLGAAINLTEWVLQTDVTELPKIFSFGQAKLNNNQSEQSTIPVILGDSSNNNLDYFDNHSLSVFSYHGSICLFQLKNDIFAVQSISPNVDSIILIPVLNFEQKRLNKVIVYKKSGLRPLENQIK